MKNGDFVVWRYHEDSNMYKTLTRFGIMECIETFHYVIKDIETGQTHRVVQSFMAIIFDKKYEKIHDLDRDRLYTKEELNEIFGVENPVYSKKQAREIYIDYQDDSKLLK